MPVSENEIEWTSKEFKAVSINRHTKSWFLTRCSPTGKNAREILVCR
jgi:hypothetical protein